MRRATLEELVEVRHLAVNKLSGLEELLSPMEYEHTMFSAMQSIASDLNLRVVDSLVTIDSPVAIESYERYAPLAVAAHLLILCELREIQPWIAKLCAESRVRTLIILGSQSRRREAEELALGLDAIPVFFMQNAEDVLTLLDQLEWSPHEGLKCALNSERVSLRFLEGNPS